MNFFSKGKDLVYKHKFISFIVLIALIAGGYYGYGAVFTKKAGTTYVTSTVANGTITTSVSGSGQVAASNTINLQFQASGTLIYLPVQNGQTVSKGQLIAELDTTNAQESITNDESQLQSAQISLQRLEGASTLTVPQNKQDAIDTLNQDYQSSYNTVSSVFTDLPTIMTDLQTIVYGNTFNNQQQNIDFYTDSTQTYDPTATTFKTSLVKSYTTALSEYTKNFNDYKSTSRYSSNTDIDSIVSETYSTTKDIAQAIKDTNNLIQFYENTFSNYDFKVNPQAAAQLTLVNSDSAKTDSDISGLLSIQNTIIKDNEAVTNSGLDLQSAQLSVQNAQNSLANDKANLANYYIYAPFNGTLGKLSLQVGDQVGSGTSVATEVTTQDICTIPLNEVDAAKVQPGQKVVLTFNALPDLSVAGQVATIDPIGTVSSGVVTYNVQISFDTQDARVKPGMSINANVITAVAQNVLVIPNSAIKTQGNIKYVQVLVNGAPQQKAVTVGLVNDTNSQILTGLNAGDKVITQTINASATSTTATPASGSAVRIPGVGGGGGFGGGRGGL